MTFIHGKIGSLKKVKETLDRRGITRFNSVADINKFIKDFDAEKEELLFTLERDFDLELNTLQSKELHLQKDYDSQKVTAEIKLQIQINKLKNKCDILRNPAKNAVLELFYWYQLQILLAIKFILQKGFNGIIWMRTYEIKKQLQASLKKTNEFNNNRQTIISNRYDTKLKALHYIQSVATELYPLIAGAIGENLVVEELKKLSGTYILINDFSFVFEKPIYYKQNNARILSIQIDHLLVTSAGIFILETKNWSKTSLANRDLWSPIEQMQRANFALYTLLRGTKATGNMLLKEHHWGLKRIPIKNILVMIHHRPKERFNNVAVKTLKELNSYIVYFEPIFDYTEVRSIGDYLLRIKG